MKATGIVRRIDYPVIIPAKGKSLENTGISLILSNFAIPKPAAGCCERRAAKPNHPRGRSWTSEKAMDAFFVSKHDDADDISVS